MAYITINFDKLSRDDWDNWCEAWGREIDCEEDTPCPEGEWDVFFREGTMPEPGTQQYWSFLANKYWDFLCEEEEERYTNSFDVNEDCWRTMSSDQRYNPCYARAY